MKKKTSRPNLKRIQRAHAVFFFISFGLYVVLSAILTPSFVLSDMHNKSTALADETITLVARVLAPPVTPIVSGSAICMDGNLSVQLNWPADKNSKSFAIDRDGLPLITGLTDSQYIDLNITTNTSYVYTITAYGPMGPGFATSQPITITTPEKCAVAPLPFLIKITSFQNSAIENFTDIPHTTSLTPVFSGTTTISHAKIFITLYSGSIVTAVIYANENGYWSWNCPETLSLGEHILYVSAVDPADPTITASNSFSFEIISESTSQKTDADHTKKAPNKKTSTVPEQVPTEIIQTMPFAITVTVENPNHIVYAGNNLSIQTDFTKKSSTLENREYEIFYDIVDADEHTVSEIYERINPTQIDSLKKDIAIPILTKAERYKIVVKIYDGKNLIESEDFFQVTEFPLLSIGSTTISLAQVVRGLGWLSLLFFLFFLILLGIEHHLSERALFQITENYLQRKGFFTKRKGVSR